MTSYTTFIKHAEKVAKAASGSRPILKGVHHAIDGSVAVTDSHRLYVLNNGYNTPEAFTSDAKTGEKLEGTYPDVARLFPYDDDAISTITLTDVKKVATIVKQLATIEKGANADSKQVMFRLNVTDSSATLTSGEKECVTVNYTYAMPVEIEGNAEQVTLNAQYLSEALALFADAHAHKVVIRINGSMRPITLKSDDLSVLILPIRTY